MEGVYWKDLKGCFILITLFNLGISVVNMCFTVFAIDQMNSLLGGL